MSWKSSTIFLVELKVNPRCELLPENGLSLGSFVFLVDLNDSLKDVVLKMLGAREEVGGSSVTS
jgi:hypothetical protein